jgi:hypothetical protein
MIMVTTSARTPRAVYASSGCNLGTLNGNYGFTDSGFSAHGSHGSTPFPSDAVGIAAFDGEGDVSATFASSFDGSSSTGNLYTGTYTVNSDCTGLLTSTNGGDNFAFVIVSGGADVLGTDISAGTTAQIEFKKQ